jgi:hypothetical protein
MRKYRKSMKFYKIAYFIILSTFFQVQAIIEITNAHAQEIGKKIWHNECNGTIDGLTSWNHGEEFPSLGIGHFIWYPTNQTGPFQESFPSLLAYLQANGKQLPQWLAQSNGCPWKERSEFIANQNSKKMQELRTLLLDTIDLQTQFIIERLQKIVSTLHTKLPKYTFAHIKRQFLRVANNPNGIYALIDYINFKGAGFNAHESYHGHRWGLVEVLKNMRGTNLNSALADFTASAKKVLDQRIANAPAERNEHRWREGWFNRLNTYLN